MPVAVDGAYDVVQCREGGSRSIEDYFACSIMTASLSGSRSASALPVPAPASSPAPALLMSPSGVGWTFAAVALPSYTSRSRRRAMRIQRNIDCGLGVQSTCRLNSEGYSKALHRIPSTESFFIL